MKLQKMDTVVKCTVKACIKPNEEFLFGEGHAMLHQAGDEVVVQPICIACTEEFQTFGLPVSLVSELIKRDEEWRLWATSRAEVLAAHSARQKKAFDGCDGVVYPCSVPLCISLPGLASKMSAVVSVPSGKKKINPICSQCAEAARKRGIEVKPLTIAIQNQVNHMQRVVNTELDQQFEKFMTPFFERCLKSGSTYNDLERATTPAHRDPGYKGDVRLTPASK